MIFVLANLIKPLDSQVVRKSLTKEARINQEMVSMAQNVKD